jgi:hypothetical protein
MYILTTKDLYSANNRFKGLSMDIQQVVMLINIGTYNYHCHHIHNTQTP